jgi:hypothetical protein
VGHIFSIVQLIKDDILRILQPGIWRKNLCTETEVYKAYNSNNYSSCRYGTVTFNLIKFNSELKSMIKFIPVIHYEQFRVFRLTIREIITVQFSKIATSSQARESTVYICVSVYTVQYNKLYPKIYAVWRNEVKYLSFEPSVHDRRQ